MNNTPPHMALRHSDIVETLLDMGADPTLTNANGETPLDKRSRMAEPKPRNSCEITRIKEGGSSP